MNFGSQQSIYDLSLSIHHTVHNPLIKEKHLSFPHHNAMPRSRAAAVLALALLPALAGAAAAAATVYRRVAPSPGHRCGVQGTYGPGGTYEANLRLLAATVPAQANGSTCKCSPGNHAGERPDQVAASAYCYWRPDGSPATPDCGACIALAFREAQRLCPYHRQAMVVVDGGGCSVSFHDMERMEQGIGAGLTELGEHAPCHESLCQYVKEMARYLLEKKLEDNTTGNLVQALESSPQCIFGMCRTEKATRGGVNRSLDNFFRNV
ncbi:hypothetical protein ACP70R_004464 [Stipagrostis hirtigluma subsp. patula]